MSYSVKEIFYTLQGEGANTGRPAVFCRFAGCNLWSGLEGDREGATCDWCDTDFVGTDGPGGGKFETAEELAAAIATRWPPENGGRPLGGKRREPMTCDESVSLRLRFAQGFFQTTTLI